MEATLLHFTPKHNLLTGTIVWQSDMQEKHTGETCLKDTDQKVLEACLSFMYGKLESIPEEVSLQLFMFADKYQVCMRPVVYLLLIVKLHSQTKQLLPICTSTYMYKTQRYWLMCRLCNCGLPVLNTCFRTSPWTICLTSLLQLTRAVTMDF